MNIDTYAVTLNNALNEIKKAYPEIKKSFIFTKEGSIVTGDQETDEKTMKKILESFENLKEKTKTIGNLTGFYITGKNGKLMLSNIKDMYLVLATSENADKLHIYSITQVIIPTLLKTLDTIAPSIQLTPPKKLVVDTPSGLFADDSVQIDTEILRECNNGELTENTGPPVHVKAALTADQNSQESIDHVQIETFGGNSTLCNVKEVNDQKLKGKNMIRIPEKLCKTLKISEGDLVKVKPDL